MTATPDNPNGYDPSSPVLPVPDLPDPPTEPPISVQTQIGMLLTAIAALITFIFHKDFSATVPAVTTLAFAGYGAAAAIARAMKHRTNVQATVAARDQKVSIWAHQNALVEGVSAREVQQAFNQAAQHVSRVEAKVDALTPAKTPRKTAKKAAVRPVRGRTPSRTTTRTRRKPPPF